MGSWRVLPLLLAAAAALAAGPAPPRLTSDQRARLEAGEVLVRLERQGSSPFKEGIGIGLLKAPPERVFRALTDHDHFDEWVPFVVRSDARAQADGSVLNAQSLDLPAPVGDRRYTLRAVAAVEGTATGRVWRSTWTYVRGSGNVADHHGSWLLVEHAPGRTLAVCRLFTDPGGAVPGWAMNRATARSLPWIFDGLRQHVRRSRYDEPR